MKIPAILSALLAIVLTEEAKLLATHLTCAGLPYDGYVHAGLPWAASAAEAQLPIAAQYIVAAGLYNWAYGYAASYAGAHAALAATGPLAAAPALAATAPIVEAQYAAAYTPAVSAIPVAYAAAAPAVVREPPARQDFFQPLYVRKNFYFSSNFQWKVVLLTANDQYLHWPCERFGASGVGLHNNK